MYKLYYSVFVIFGILLRKKGRGCITCGWYIGMTELLNFYYQVKEQLLICIYTYISHARGHLYTFVFICSSIRLDTYAHIYKHFKTKRGGALFALPYEKKEPRQKLRAAKICVTMCSQNARSKHARKGVRKSARTDGLKGILKGGRHDAIKLTWAECLT